MLLDWWGGFYGCSPPIRCIWCGSSLYGEHQSSTWSSLCLRMAPDLCRLRIIFNRREIRHIRSKARIELNCGLPILTRTRICIKYFQIMAWDLLLWRYLWWSFEYEIQLLQHLIILRDFCYSGVIKDMKFWECLWFHENPRSFSKLEIAALTNCVSSIRCNW